MYEDNKITDDLLLLVPPFMLNISMIIKLLNSDLHDS